jgi:hypothetical protein
MREAWFVTRLSFLKVPPLERDVIPVRLAFILDIYQRDVAIVQCALHSCPWEACAVSLKQAIRTAARV